MQSIVLVIWIYQRHFAYVDYYKGIPIYAVLNHLRSSKELISKLGENILKGTFDKCPD